MKNVCIVIPIYKSKLNDFEEKSLSQAAIILNKYDFRFVTYEGLNTSKYIEIAQKYSINYSFEFFDRDYFNGLNSYNRLMLSISFYKRFKPFNYILIYQLDAFVFKDELDEWCNKGFDYIGAPWVVSEGNSFVISGAGNGGFSLRKISSQIRVLKCFKRVIPFWELYERYSLNTRGRGYRFKINEMLKLFLHLTVRNNTNYRFNSNDYFLEDDFWVRCNDLFKWYNVADVGSSIKFSFETHPSYLFKLNNNTLPFGCHAWNKYEYECFWQNIIKI